MTGNNTILLNKATMMEALQYYFDNVLFAADKAPKVTGISGLTGTGSYETKDMFTVNVNSEKEA